MPPFAKIVVLLSALLAIGGWFADQREAKLDVPDTLQHYGSGSG